MEKEEQKKVVLDLNLPTIVHTHRSKNARLPLAKHVPIQKKAIAFLQDGMPTYCNEN